MNAQLLSYSISTLHHLLRFVRLQKGLDPEEEFTRRDIDDLDSFVRSNYPSSKKPEPPKPEVCEDVLDKIVREETERRSR